MDTPEPDQDEHGDDARAPTEVSADGGNGDSGQQLEQTSGHKQPELQDEDE